jgi:hypothetical protein
MNLTLKEYIQECKSCATVAEELATENGTHAQEELAAIVEDHDYVLYECYYTAVLQHSDNDNAFYDNGLLTVAFRSTSEALRCFVHAAFLADCQEELS